MITFKIYLCSYARNAHTHDSFWVPREEWIAHKFLNVHKVIFCILSILLYFCSVCQFKLDGNVFWADCVKILSDFPNEKILKNQKKAKKL